MKSNITYTDDQWKALHAELVAGLKSGKYNRPGEFYKEKAIPHNTMWYVCNRLGLTTQYKQFSKGARQMKKTGKFVQFAPVETAQLEVIIDGRIKIMVPRGDMASVKQIADTFRVQEAA